MEDKRLERLYDYTKWHLGIYLSVAGALTAGVGFLAEEDKSGRLAPYFAKPAWLLAAVVLMFLAGICGAVVASSCTECETYAQLWDKKHGPFGLKLMEGKKWAALEHLFFWLSVGCTVIAVLTSSPVSAWLKK